MMVMSAKMMLSTMFVTRKYAENANHKHDAKSVKSSLACMILIVICLLVCDVQCQFFTKSSPKSIPRMGRRSLPDNDLQQARLTPFRRMLIDRLVDEFGPNLVARLQEQAKMAAAAAATSSSESGGEVSKSASGGGELYERNDQPFDLNMLISDSQAADDGARLALSRNERGGGGAVDNAAAAAAAVASGDGFLSNSPTQRNFKQNTKSLAMRAFNTDRLLQHLASGGSPVLPYNRLLVTQGNYNNLD